MTLLEALKVAIYLCDPETPEEAEAAAMLARLEESLPILIEDAERLTSAVNLLNGTMRHAILSRLDTAHE